MNSGVYSIVNMNGGAKIYIGSTTNFKRRWAHHKARLWQGKHANLHLQLAWNKYGEDAFGFMVCEYVEDKEMLHTREQYWLDWHKLQTDVYNWGPIARNAMLGTHPSKKTKHKMSKAHMGKKHSEETRRKISRGLEGKVISEKARAKIGKAGAKPYPAFTHRETGEFIPAGINLSNLCRERGLSISGMCSVKTGKRIHHKNWILQQERE